MTTTATKPKRIDYTDNQHSILYAETGGCCPLCRAPILFRKPGAKKITKSYEVAHIFPLHPTPAQTQALAGRTPPIDINGLENVIALCPTCHTRFDKNFEIDEMDHIRKLKDRFLADAKAKETAAQYGIQQEVFGILDKIAAMGSDVAAIPPAQFEISTVEKKLRNGMSQLQQSEIKLYATSYYIRIRDHIRLLEQNDQLSIRILQSQIQTYYLEMQRQHPANKDAVFTYVAEWISSRTGRSMIAARVLTSFFVQNCEVFDAGA
ncbi:ABC-three component system protein [Paracidovorax konjaci]|uniref:HNH endonuclease n=1 Tax=Paracidovorax konjaci TaxID=32040 RepID=A0A1I1TW84_9BURK|nr:ABC-three component system protein [Paracidovorax konjaci]SFD62936.1 HNH endonuclease [Paracidovorax konjaci]